MYRYLLAVGVLVSAVVCLTACSADKHVSRLEKERATTVTLAAAPLPVDQTHSGDSLLVQAEVVNGYALRLVRSGDLAILAEFRGRNRQLLPALSPNGKLVALYARADSGTHHLVIWDMRSGAESQPDVLPTAVVTKSQWDTSSRQLSHVVEQAGRRDLFRLSVAANPESTTSARVAEITMRSGITWSPDGDRVAFVPAADSGSLSIVARDGSEQRIRIVPALGAVRDLSWSQDGRTIAATARALNDNAFRLFKIDVRKGTGESVINEIGDISLPWYLPAASGIAFRARRGMRVVSVACRSNGLECLELAPDDALESTILGRSGDGQRIFIRKRWTSVAPSLVAARRVDGHATPIFEPAQTEQDRSDGRWLDIVARDGLHLPTYLWAAKRGAESRRAVVVYVSGAKQQIPQWEKQYPYLFAAGIDLVLTNHRGRSGYSAALERAPGGVSAQVSDILSTIDFVVDSLHVPIDDILLFGHSHGALLAARAAAENPSIKHLILASMPEDSSGTRPAALPRCTVAFHGEVDPFGPNEGRAVIKSILGAQSVAEPCGHFEVFPEEPHVYERARSWSTIFAAMVTALGRR